MYMCFKNSTCKCASDILGYEFHSEMVLGTKEYKREFVCASKRLKVHIISNSTMAE